MGKYVGLEDSYKSLNEALYHGGFKHRVKVHINWVEAEALEHPEASGCSTARTASWCPAGSATAARAG